MHTRMPSMIHDHDVSPKSKSMKQMHGKDDGKQQQQQVLVSDVPGCKQ